jgi:hypothetical protein
MKVATRDSISLIGDLRRLASEEEKRANPFLMLYTFKGVICTLERKCFSCCRR